MAFLKKMHWNEKMKNNKSLQIVNNENVACFDVDFTLIEECLPSNKADKILDIRTGEYEYFKPYHEHIKLLKQMKGRGRFVIVWSAGGYYWAEAVVKYLGLEKYVDLIMTKPGVMVDDKPIQEWTTRVYLPKKGKK